MASSYADISLINTTFGISHTFDDDVDGSGLIEALTITPTFGGTLTPLLDGGAARTGGDPAGTEVAISGTIKAAAAGTPSVSDTITSIQQVLHNGRFKIRFGNDNLELTDCVVQSFTYVPVVGASTSAVTFELTITSGAKYFTTTSTSSASTSISGATTSGTVTCTGFDSDAPVRPIITVTRDGASTVDTTFEFRIVNDGQTKTPEFRWVTAKMGADDVLVTDPFLEQTYVSTNNSGVAQVPTRVDGVVPHLHELLGSSAPQVEFTNTTGHSDFTVQVEWYTYRLFIHQQ
jgi:hypothetical protein